MPRLPVPGSDQGEWGTILNEFLTTTLNSDGTLKPNSVSASHIQNGSIPASKLDTSVQAALDSAVSGVAPDASASTKGILRLTGDLTGNALNPLIAPGAVTGGGGGSIATGTITNANVHTNAAIAKSKLAPLAVTDADVSSSAAIAQSKVSGLVADLAGKAASSHSHAISGVTGLQTALDSKADDTATTAALATKANTADVTTALNAKANSADLTSGLAGKANTSHTHTVANVTGLQTTLTSLSADITGKADTADLTTLQAQIDDKADTADVTASLNTKADSVHSHTIANVTNLQTTLDSKANAGDVTTSLAGKANTSHTHTTASITDLDTHVSDLIGNKLIPGSNVSISYDEGSGETTISSTAAGGGGGGSTTVDTVAGRVGDVVLVAGDITGGTFATARIPNLDANKITSGALDIARIPTGTTGSTVSFGNHGHSTATTSVAGFMAAADKTKLDGIATGATSYTHPSGDGNLHVPATGTTNNGRVLRAGGTAGSLSWSTLSATDVGAAATTHSHSIANVSGLQTALDEKAAGSHAHDIADVTNLQTTLDGKAATTHTHAATAITSGTLDAARVPNLAASKITSGTLDVARIPTGITDTTVALGDHTHTEYSVTSHNHDSRYYTESEVDAALSAKLNTSEKGTSNGLATLGSDGKIPASQIPAIAINDTFTVASQAAMLALTAQRGDMAIRTDNSRTYVLSSDSPSTLADWRELLAAGSGGGEVSSVAGKTGAVTLVKADVGLANVDNTADTAKPISTATQTALNAKVPYTATTRLVIYASAANTWPTRSAWISANAPGFTGRIEWDHSAFGTVTTVPASIATHDWVTDEVTG